MRAKTNVNVAEHLQAAHWPLGEFEGEALDRLDRLDDVALGMAHAVGVAPSVDELQARIQALEDILSAIAIGSAPRGRWLDVRSTAIDGFNDEEVPPTRPERLLGGVLPRGAAYLAGHRDRTVPHGAGRRGTMRTNGLAVRFCARAGKHRLWFVEWPLDGWVGPDTVGSFAWQFYDLVRAT